MQGFSVIRKRDTLNKYGFYIIKDIFFNKFPDPYLKGNKQGNRPHYYCFQDETDGLYWVIPMSSRVEKYEKIIELKQKQHKSCDILHICKLSNGKRNMFLIQDMFPITDSYIERPYTFANIPLVLVGDKERNIINAKALRILNLINNKTKFNPTQPNVLYIKEQLIQELQSKRLIKV